MSDGGAGAIVEIVSLLGRTKAGRVVLVVMVCYIGVQYVASQVSRAGLVAAGVVVAGIAALAAGFVVQRRRRRERASMYQWLAFLGLAVTASATALFVIARRRKASVLAPPPPAAEVERLAALEARRG